MMDGEQDRQNIRADHDSVAVGSVSVGGSVDGSLIIGSHNVVGFMSDQVSTLIAQISTTFQPKPFDGRSPYKGLDVFEEEDAELFFGREKLVEDLVVRVRESRTLFVTGPSGSGKSSLVRAGLIHALKQGTNQALTSDRWLYATMKPGRDPIEALASAFSRLKDPGLGKYLRENSGQASALHECAESVLTERKDQRLVLFIDQFEEVFTQLGKDKAETFIQLLDCAASIDNGRTILLFAMRSDFIPNCVVYPRLNALLNRQFVQIGAMQGDELVSAIAQPALRVGLRIDPDLIAQIINDMQGEPGALPLMQFALKDLFDAQQAKGGLIALLLKDYLERGGIRKALERHADNSFNRLNGHERKLTRAIFSSLIEIGRGTVDTRRTAVFDELVPASARNAEVEAIVRKLADARLLTTDEIGGKDTVTISHEKLIDAWPWLKRLVDENRDVIAAQNEIAKDAKEWDDHGRDPSYLYSGSKLGVAQEQLSANKMVLSGLAKDFIDEAIALREAERKAKESLRRRIIGGLVAGIVIALVLAGFAAYKSIQANKQANIARAGELSALAILEKDKHFDLSILLGIESLSAFRNSRTRGTLITLSDSHQQLKNYIFGHTAAVNSIAFSPDGYKLASGSSDHSIILWDLSDPTAPSKLTTIHEHADAVTSIAFGPDGRQLASGSSDGSIILWDVSNPATPAGVVTLSGHTRSISSLTFSQDGRHLISGDDSNVILWDISNPKQSFPLGKVPGGLYAFRPDGKQMALAGGQANVTIWDISNPEEPSKIGSIPFDRSFTTVAFSFDGKQIVLGGYKADLELWDISNPESPSELPALPVGYPIFSSAVFSPDGKLLVFSDANTTLWDMSNPVSPLQIAALSGHIAFPPIRSEAFSPDGKELALGGTDGTIILWNVDDDWTSSTHLTTFAGDEYPLMSVAFSADGKQLASGNGNSSVVLWDIHNLLQPTKISKLPVQSEGGMVYSLAFSPDSKRLLSVIDERFIPWNITNPSAPKQIAVQPGSSNRSVSGVFSADSKLLASKGYEESVTLWDISNPGAPSQLGTLPETSKGLSNLALSPDGKWLAGSVSNYSIILWDISNPSAPSQVATLSGHDNDISSIAFSRDSQIIASGSGDNSMILWDISNPRAPLQLATLAGPTYWPLQAGVPFTSIAFSPDNTKLASAGFYGITLWDLDTESLVKKACERAGRNFNRAEWAQYIPYKPYPSKQEEATCQRWPLEPKPVATSTATP